MSPDVDLTGCDAMIISAGKAQLMVQLTSHHLLQPIDNAVTLQCTNSCAKVNEPIHHDATVVFR